jgi:hypothetical protein
MPFSGVNYSPDTLRLMYRALEAAWLTFEHRGQSQNPGEVRQLMSRRIMMAVALGETNVERLKTLALSAADAGNVDG